MRNDLEQTLEDLRYYVTQTEQAADAADAVFMRLQGCLAALERLGCVANTLFVGPGLLTKPYAPDVGGHNSCLVAQAALRIPGGIGVVWVDSERQSLEQGLVDNIDQAAECQFEAYQSCPPVLRGLIVKHVPQLLNDLARWVPFPRHLQAAQGLSGASG